MQHPSQKVSVKFGRLQYTRLPSFRKWTLLNRAWLKLHIFFSTGLNVTWAKWQKFEFEPPAKRTPPLYRPLSSNNGQKWKRQQWLLATVQRQRLQQHQRLYKQRGAETWYFYKFFVSDNQQKTFILRKKTVLYSENQNLAFSYLSIWIVVVVNEFYFTLS